MDRFYTGGSAYYIVFRHGTYCIKEDLTSSNVDETVFTGTYEECLAERDRMINDNADYDLNL